MSEKTPLINPLVGSIYDLDERIETLKLERAQLAQELIEEGEGTYLESGAADARKILVIVPSEPSTSYTLYPDAALKAFLEERKVKKATAALKAEFMELQEQRARDLAGDHFKSLFDRSVIFGPTKGFAQIVPKLFPTATATVKKLLLLCQVVKPAADPYIKLPDKKKIEAEAED